MKTSHMIILSVLVVILAFIGLLYFTLKTKTKNVTAVEPYTAFINQKLILERDVLLVKNRDAYVFEKPFLIVEMDDVLDEEITEKQLIKAGTPLTINKATLFTNGTSGGTTSVVFGSIATKNGEIEFEHVWGNEHSTLSVNEPNYFTFPKPIWESENNLIDKRYILKK